MDDLELVFASGLLDAAGNVLDGDGDGIAGGNVVSTFAIDTTAPQVTATTPAQDMGDTSITEITIDFSEAINPSSFSMLQVMAYDFDGTLQGSLFASYGTWNGDYTSVTWTLAEARGDGHYEYTLSGDPAGGGRQRPGGRE